MARKFQSKLPGPWESCSLPELKVELSRLKRLHNAANKRREKAQTESSEAYGRWHKLAAHIERREA